jgi:hypothetical protein
MQKKKKFVRLHLNRKKLGMVAHTCHPSYGRRHKYNSNQAGLDTNMTRYLKNNQKPKGMGMWLR